jgi:hypothetical protein
MDTAVETPSGSDDVEVDESDEQRFRREQLARNMRELRDAVERKEAADAAERLLQSDRDWREAFASFQERAARATGLTVEELIAQAEALAKEVPTEIVIKPNRRRWMEDAGAPPLHIQNVYDREPIACEALVAVQSFLADPTTGFLLLVGGKGTLKTGSACWALSRRSPGFFTKSKKLLDLAFGDKPAFKRLSTAKVVVFDELGWEKPDGDGHWITTFVDLFDDWYGNLTKVIFTANLGDEDRGLTALEDFKQRYGVRVYDRMRERGRLVEIGGDSRRRRPMR